MQISCPSCHAQYTVPEAKIAGRQTKCAQCGTQWVPVPRLPPPPERPQLQAPAPEPLPPEPLMPPLAAAIPVPAQSWAPSTRPSRPAPPLPAAAARPLARRFPVRDPALLAAWVASVLLLVAAAAGGYAGREGIMHAWPPSQRLYGALGLK